MSDFPSIPMTTEETIEFNKWLEGHDKHIKADAIEEFANWLPQHFDLRFSNNPSVWIDEYFNHTREKTLEQLKEQK